MRVAGCKVKQRARSAPKTEASTVSKVAYHGTNAVISETDRCVQHRGELGRDLERALSLSSDVTYGLNAAAKHSFTVRRTNKRFGGGAAYWRQGELLVALSLGSTKMTAEHDPAAGLLQVLDGGQGLLQARRVGNFAGALVLQTPVGSDRRTQLMLESNGARKTLRRTRARTWGTLKSTRTSTRLLASMVSGTSASEA